VDTKWSGYHVEIVRTHVHACVRASRFEACAHTFRRMGVKMGGAWTMADIALAEQMRCSSCSEVEDGIAKS
jgi:hypothetical protein